MALLTMPSDYVVGTISLINGSVDFTGTGTAWQLVGLKEGDLLIDVDGATQFWAIIDEISSNVAGKLTRPWAGPDLTDALYRMRFTSDGVRSTAQAAMLRQELGNGRVQAISTATGTSGVLEYLPGGGAQLVPKTDLINGVAVDKRVNTMDDRAAYDTQADQFSVYVADVGDAFGVENAGRAATFFRDGDTTGVWSDPAYMTGETGDKGDRGDEGPTGPGFKFIEGGYDSGTAYVVGDVVRDNGSSWIALQATTGNAPPVYPVAANDWWELVAAKGQDGTGTGDMVGPASSVDGRIAAADGTSGKLLKFLTAAQATATLTAVVGDSGSGGTKGLVPAPAAGDAAGRKFLKADGSWSEVRLDEVTPKLLGLHVSEFKQAAVFLGEHGNTVADAWHNDAYIDTVNSTGANFSVPGGIKPAASAGGTVASNAGTGSAPGWSGHTVVVVVSAAQVAVTGFGTVEVSFDAGTTENLDIAVAYIGHGSATGDVYDFDAAPTQLLFPGASASGTAPMNGTIKASATFTVQPGKKLLVAWQGGASASADDASNSAATGWEAHWKTITGEAANVNKTGYSYVAYPLAVSKIELVPLSVDMTVYLGPFDVGVGPDAMAALLRVKEIDAVTINADYTLRASRDGKATWADVTLTELFTSPSPMAGSLIVRGAEADVSGQTDAGELWYELATHNGKIVEFHGCVFDWRGGEPP